jgi:allantoicase
MSASSEWPDLAAERLGGAALAANDEFFAPKENLLKAAAPVFVEDRYTDRGKWMDGWETRRRRTPGHDWCVVRLGLPGILREVVVDTRHFKGNYPESCSLEGLGALPAGEIAGTDVANTTDRAEIAEMAGTADLGAGADPAGALDPSRLAGAELPWIEVLPRSPLEGDRENRFSIASPYRFAYLRLNIFPDGGVARLRVHGESVPEPRQLAGEIDLAAAVLGGRATASSDGFFGSPQKLLLPGPATHMGDGWETRRRRGPGNDWAVVRLAVPGVLRRVEVDTSHFKGNAPGSCALFGCTMETAAGDVPGEGAAWREILPPTALAPDTRHFFAGELRDAGPLTHVRLDIFPDGGVARLRLHGEATEAGRLAAGLRWLDSLPPAEAEAALLTCCGSREWARRMAGERPFGDRARLGEAAERIWRALAPEDWREALAAHPRIGEPPAGGRGVEKRWAAGEQSGTADAPGDVRAALAAANRAYEERFGMTYVVCATGKSAAEMLALCRNRLANDPETELRIAADEQLEITRLRLDKLLRGKG